MKPPKEKQKEKKVFVLDTNVIVHDYDSIFKFQEHDVCIPSVVMQELDSFKKGNETINVNVREFHRKLKKLRETLVKKTFTYGKVWRGLSW
jgi:PhoH-like ATPase